MDFEVGLRVSAYRAHLRCFGSYDDVSAITTLPHLYLASLEYFCGLHVMEQGTIALLVAFLYSRYGADLGGKFRKAFLIGRTGEAFVHIRPFVVLPCCRCR